ncbi:MAG: DNA polymerase I [Chthonomonadetes bacterium]|nr:DNA polymerase I [Chthonomonadetes bacterium]
MTQGSASTPKLVLIDGHSLLYRAFYATRPLSTTDGRPTNAIYGFAGMLWQILEEEQPDAIVVAFDTAAPTFRHEEFTDYKAHRPETAESFYVQVPAARELVEAMGIPVVALEGYEADDVLGTLTQRARQQGYQVIIVTGDQDALQLVDEGAFVLMPQKGMGQTVRYDQQAVRERFGLEPSQLPDFKALKGDPSDNIPGVPGIGDKKAAALLKQFGSVESLLQRLHEVEDPKLRALLEQYREQIPQYKRLATIVRDAPVPDTPPRWKPTPEHFSRLQQVLESLEFRSFLRRLPELRSRFIATETPTLPLEAPAEVRTVGVRWEVARSEDEVRRLVGRCLRLPKVGVRVLIEGAHVMELRITGVAVALSPEEAIYVPGGMSPTSLFDEAGDGLVALLAPLWESEAVAKAGYNVKPLQASLIRAGVQPRQVVFDAMLAGYVLQSGRSSYPLADLVQDYLGERLPTEDTTTGDGLAAYTCAEAAACLRLETVMNAQVAAMGCADVLHRIEMPLSEVLARMELAGVAVDVDYLTQLSSVLDGLIRAKESEIYTLAGEPFNIASPKQLGYILFEKLKLPAGKKTRTGAYSTDAEVLEQLAVEHPICRSILEYRELSKLKSTYADVLPRLVHPATGRIHTSFNQTVAATGRLSSSEPNLQNIPIRSEVGRQIRRAFVSAPGNRLLAADYSQIELRLLAHVSGDERLLQAFAEDRDIHSATAMLLFGVPPDGVTPELRRKAKTVNFAVLYGMSDYGLSQELGMPVAEARAFIENYFRQLPGVRRYIEETLNFARQHGYVTTLYGRRRYVPEINHANRNVRQAAERAAINSPLQGTAADIIKLAMVELDRRLRQEGWKAKMVLQVHDELVLDAPPEEIPALANLVRECMSQVASLRVPLKVDVEVGNNWAEMERLAP